MKEKVLIVCSFLQDFSKGKGSSFQSVCNAHTAFLLCGADIIVRRTLYNPLALVPNGHAGFIQHTRLRQILCPTALGQSKVQSALPEWVIKIKAGNRVWTEILSLFSTFCLATFDSKTGRKYSFNLIWKLYVPKRGCHKVIQAIFGIKFEVQKLGMIRQLIYNGKLPHWATSWENFVTPCSICPSFLVNVFAVSFW